MIFFYASDKPIKQGKYKRVKANIIFDMRTQKYIVSRLTPKTKWIERYTDYKKAVETFYKFLYLSNKQLEDTMIRNLF